MILINSLYIIVLYIVEIHSTNEYLSQGKLKFIDNLKSLKFIAYIVDRHCSINENVDIIASM